MKILLVRGAIAPMQSIAAIRWTKIAKYLKKCHGEEISIDVLTNKKNYDSSDGSTFCTKDTLLEKEMRYFDHYFAVPVDDGVISLMNRCKKAALKKGRTYISAEERLKHSSKAYIKSKISKIYHTYYCWVVSRALVGAMKNKAGEYDVVISSYLPIWSFMVCSKLKKENSKLKWICDFRDTCGRDNIDMSGYAHWHIHYVRKHSALADAVLHVDDFIDTHTDPRVKDYTVTNGYDPEEAAAPEKPVVFDLIYTGSLYGNQESFGVVYQAINELIAEGEIDRKKVRVLYAGKAGQLAQLMAEAHGGAEYFTNLDVIPRYKVLELQSKAAILIQAAFNVEGDHCAWTGKMYEYMMSQKPIVYVVNGNIPHSFPSKYMERLGGVCYEASRHEETYPILKEYIYTKYREWEETGNVSIVQDKDYVGKYSYKVIAEQVWEILNSL